MWFASRKRSAYSSKNKTLCIFTKYSDNGPSSRYRIMIFEPDLQRNYDVKEFRFWSEKYYSTYVHDKKKYIIQIGFEYIVNLFKRVFQLFLVAPKCDIVFFQKCVIPLNMWNNIRYLRQKGCRVLFDVDDAVYVKDSDGTVGIAKAVDAVIAGNPLLADFYGRFNENVVILPTVDYTPEYEKFHRDTFENKTIFWLGSAATIDNLDILIEPINALIKVHPEVKFKYICNADHGYTEKIHNAQFIKWKKETCIPNMSEATIGLMPLKDNEYNRGKCGFKLIQYMNLGKPVVASDVGVNAEIIGKCGYIARTTEDWVILLEKLLFDESSYRECERQIYTNFLEKYGYTTALNKLIKVING